MQCIVVSWNNSKMDKYMASVVPTLCSYKASHTCIVHVSHIIHLNIHTGHVQLYIKSSTGVIGRRSSKQFV